MSKEADRLIAWLGEVHAVPPFDVGGLVRDVETAAEERGRRRGYGQCRDDAAAVVDAAFQAGKWEGLYAKIQSLAPRDSGKEG